MCSSWPKYVGKCKSRLSAIARCCFLGREGWIEKYRLAQAELRQLQAEKLESSAQVSNLNQEIRELRGRVVELEAALAQPRPLELPLGTPPRRQHFGDGLITLCVNLARKIGLRGSVGALKVFFKWLSVEVRIPTWQVIRKWMQRIGLHRLRAAKKQSGGMWLADHSNQIGQEKVLLVARVRKNRLGCEAPLRHQDVEIIALQPGQQWKREDVERVYQQTAKRCGIPRAIGTDGAVELREPAESLGKRRKKPLVIRDLKHFLANKFEGLLIRDRQYEAFVKKLGGTRSALQQTELAHFIPPGFKTKARFMNIKPILDWAQTVLWHLDHPDSQSRNGVSGNRLTEKLGWLRDFAPSIQHWNNCQEVISAALALINRVGVFPGVVKEFRRTVGKVAGNTQSIELVRLTLNFLRQHSRRLRPYERLPMSTEVLESSFGLYKQFEQQHSKGGFTSLLLAFPVLLRPTNPLEVKHSLEQVKVKDTESWVKQNLSQTLTSKRQILFREPKQQYKSNTKNRATPIPTAA